MLVSILDPSTLITTNNNLISKQDTKSTGEKKGWSIVIHKCSKSRSMKKMEQAMKKSNQSTKETQASKKEKTRVSQVNHSPKGIGF